MIVSIEDWATRTMRRGSLAEFLLASPLRDVQLDLERRCNGPRDLKL